MYVEVYFGLFTLLTLHNQYAVRDNDAADCKLYLYVMSTGKSLKILKKYLEF